LDPQMIIKLKDKCKSWVLWVWFEVSFELRGFGIHLHLVTRRC
jgi:hypothetical protein